MIGELCRDQTLEDRLVSMSRGVRPQKVEGRSNHMGAERGVRDTIRRVVVRLMLWIIPSNAKLWDP